MAYQIPHAVDNDTVGMVYTDECYGIIRACNVIGLNYDLATPEVPETNDVAEHSVHDVQDGVRVLLVHAGLPAVCLVLCCKRLCNAEQWHGNGTGSR